ncbi:hypothetical protein GCM10011450_10920 [Advenella faeciporci]|uniref:ABC transmembrane type-1 domain-containing protein n=1 Tax=Advenella faeciporci TaxID=797535 RepID=A0A918JK72_9BURK|nr:hypothetical protein GCM10011450_10920 [Advenella faeciporci]
MNRETTLPGHEPASRHHNPLLLACLAPATAFFTAFWLLPAVLLVALPAEKGWQTYFLVLTDSRYMWSMINTTLLSLVTTITTLLVGGAVGIYLARRRFAGRQVLLSLLTAPLAFPGVIIGFFIILLGASRWDITRDVWLPQLAPTTVACGAIVFATAMGAIRIAGFGMCCLYAGARRALCLCPGTQPITL